MYLPHTQICQTYSNLADGYIRSSSTEFGGNFERWGHGELLWMFDRIKGGNVHEVAQSVHGTGAILYASITPSSHDAQRTMPTGFAFVYTCVREACPSWVVL